MPYRLLFIGTCLQIAALGLVIYQYVASVAPFALPLQSWQILETIEIFIVAALTMGAVINVRALSSARERNVRVEEQLAVAAGSFHDFLLQKYDEWLLSTSEREIATMIIKGFSVAEIADLRNTSQGTVKAQNTAIYRKSGLTGRVQFVSYFLEELTAGL